MSNKNKQKQNPSTTEVKVELSKPVAPAVVEERPTVKRVKIAKKPQPVAVTKIAVATPKKKLNWFQKFIKWVWS